MGEGMCVKHYFTQLPFFFFFLLQVGLSYFYAYQGQVFFILFLIGGHKSVQAIAVAHS
jgi:hypothetical protein